MLKYLNIFLKLWILVIFNLGSSVLAQQEAMQEPRPLTYAELKALSLQQEAVRSRDVKNFIETMLQQDGDAIQAARQRQLKKFAETIEQIDAEKQNAKQQENQQIQERYLNFFKRVTQNLPQKGKHQDYSSYNQQFRKPIQRR